MTTLKLKGKVNFPATVTASGGLQVVKSNGVWTVSPNFAGLTSVSAASVADPSTQQVWIYKPSDNSYAVLTLAGLGDALYKATSTTSLAIGTGSKAFTTQSGKDLGAGSYVIATSDANPTTNYMSGQITAYSGTTLTVNVTAYGGSGTCADWTIRASGSAGSTGATGAAGTNGTNGAGYTATSTSSVVIASSGSKTFTTQSGLAYTAGARVRAADSANPATNYMEGVVTSYSGTTLVFTADRSVGSGTIPSWNINLVGDKGADGAGTGDFSSNTASSVDGEIVLFSGTAGKTGKRATGSGIAKITSGVLGTATAGTDYVAATSGSAIQKANGSGGLTAATADTDYTQPSTFNALNQRASFDMSLFLG